MDAREADESVAEKFTRVMNATPSPLGAWSDFMLASVASAVVVVVGLFAVRRSSDPSEVYVIFAIASLPLLASAGLSMALRGSRAFVVRWLGSLPFPVGNMNAILAGVSDTLEVVFAPGSALPVRESLQPMLDQVSDDVLLVKTRPDERSIEIRLGIIDSKRIPLRTNHLRWKRLVEVVERVLVPLSERAAIEKVHVA
jgi:hypothetical protein